MNQINPKVLLHSKWTKVEISNKEKHFIITKVLFDDDQRVVECIIQAVFTKREMAIDWRILKNANQWKLGWK